MPCTLLISTTFIKCYRSARCCNSQIVFLKQGGDGRFWELAVGVIVMHINLHAHIMAANTTGLDRHQMRIHGFIGAMRVIDLLCLYVKGGAWAQASKI